MRALAIGSVGQAFDLVFRRIEHDDPRRRRLMGLIQGGVTSFGNRLIGMAISFVSVPLTISYLGTERYGIWVTLGSLIAWMQLTDFGLGNGLTNALTTSISRDRLDSVRTHVTNGVVLLCGMAASAGCVIGLAWRFISWSALFGVSDPSLQRDVRLAIAATIVIFLLRFPLSTAGRVLVAQQEGRIANYWGASANVLSLATLFLVTRSQGGLVWLVVAVSAVPLVVDGALNVWLYTVHRPSFRPSLAALNPTAIRPLYSVGGQFFALQIMALVTLSTDNFVISHYLGSASVPEYSLSYNLFNYTGLPQAILFQYLWSAYNEAIARDDAEWVGRTLDRNLIAGLAFTAVAAFVLLVIGQPFIAWWSRGAIMPSETLLLWMAAWSVINSFTNPIACLLAAASRMRYQIVYSAFSTVSNLVLSVSLVRVYGSTGVIAATVLSYGVFVCVPTFVDSRLLLRRLRAPS